MAFRFIIAEDAPFLREMMKENLNSIGGVCVAECGNGSECIEKYRLYLPDILLIDLVMPQKNGIEALKEIADINPEVKVIICTTLDQDQFDISAIPLKETFYLQKPFQKNELIEKINLALKTQEEELR